MIVEAAERRGIPWSYDPELRLIELGQGRHRRWIRSMTTSLESEVAVTLAQDKQLTKRLLSQAGIPVPRGAKVRREDAALAAFADLGAPVVIKPSDGHKGRGVSMNLRAPEEVLKAFEAAKRYSDTVLVEEQLLGRDYRVLVVGGEVFAAAERQAAHVIGDGEHTVAELVEKENRNPLRGRGRDKPMVLIEIDDIVRAVLAKQGAGLELVPEKGRIIWLRENANLSQGGCAIDVTDSLHPEIRKVCERAARVLRLPLCGIDLILEDIGEAIGKGGSLRTGGIIEVNAGPGIRVHHFPSRGASRDAGGAILRYLFPEGETGRVPIFAVEDAGGVEVGGLRCGVISENGIRIGDDRLSDSQQDCASSMRLLLRDPSIDAVIIAGSVRPCGDESCPCMSALRVEKASDIATWFNRRSPECSQN